MGGLQSVQQFARLYMVPGMFHCRGGYGPNDFDLILPMVTWVGQGIAPGAIVASLNNQNGELVRSRPLFPYPMRTVYNGSGSIDNAASFSGAMPSVLADDHVDWAGNDLFDNP
jgi:feruloyl esterase